MSLTTPNSIQTIKNWTIAPAKGINATVSVANTVVYTVPAGRKFKGGIFCDDGTYFKINGVGIPAFTGSSRSHTPYYVLGAGAIVTSTTGANPFTISGIEEEL